MLTKLRVKNFKAWRDSGDIRLAPLTVLFGRNSAGKSSLGQLLLMLRQTVESIDRRRALYFGDSESLVDLESYQELIFDHKLDAQLEFELSWRPKTPLQLEIAYNGGDPERARLEELGFSASVSGAEDKELQLERFTYSAGDLGEFGVSRKGGKYKLEFSKHKPKANPGRTWPLPRVLNFHGFPSEAELYYQNTGFLPDLSLSLESLLKQVFHLGPLRDPPRRMYRWTREAEQHVGQRGQRAIQALLAAKERRFNFKPRGVLSSLEQIAAKNLKDMGLIEEFHVRPIAAGRDEYEVLIKTSSKSTEVKLTDVGFGLSQLLPVLVECYCVPPGSIVVFEQPELHLHASAQAALADVFVDAVRAREDGSARSVQFIIESHSEHFLTRLQRRIAEEKIPAADVAMYFVDTEEGEAKLCDLGLDEFGNVQNWPEDFFGDEMADLVARTEAQELRQEEGER